MSYDLPGYRPKIAAKDIPERDDGGGIVSELPALFPERRYPRLEAPAGGMILIPDDAFIHDASATVTLFTYYVSGHVILDYADHAPAGMDPFGYYPLSHIERPAGDDPAGRLLCQIMHAGHSVVFSMPPSFINWCARGEMPKAIT